MLIGFLVLLNLLSILDGLLTAFELTFRIAREGNGVLGNVIAVNPFLAALLKLTLMICVSVAIWRNRRYRVMISLTLLTLAGYAALLAYHLGSLRGLGWI